MRTRISILFVVFIVAALSAMVGYQLAQGTNTGTTFDRSTSIDLLDRKKGPPPACYKTVGKDKPNEKNKNCPGGGSGGGG